MTKVYVVFNEEHLFESVWSTRFYATKEIAELSNKIIDYYIMECRLNSSDPYTEYPTP